MDVGKRQEDAPARQQAGAGRASANVGAQPRKSCGAEKGNCSGTFSRSWLGQDAAEKGEKKNNLMS